MIKLYNRQILALGRNTELSMYQMDILMDKVIRFFVIKIRLIYKIVLYHL